MFLKSLKLHGLDAVEDVIVAGLVLGDPILLVGEPGCAKTLLARRVAKALGLKFHAYDASKALFEDIIGFPSPKALSEGRVDYAPTPLSIWDKEFVLIDELSRCSPATANKWLEVIRSRTIMGMPLRNLRYVMAAMNPPGGVGTSALDLALADRFAFHVQMPEVWEMEPEDQLRIIAEVSEDDASALGGDRSDTVAMDPSTMLEEARQRYRILDGDLRESVSEYIAAFAAGLKNGKISLSGRRLGMLYRNIIAILAVRRRSPEDLTHVATDVKYTVSLSLPQGAAGTEPQPSVVAAAHGLAMRGKPSPLVVLTPQNPVRMARSYVATWATLSPRAHHEVITSLEEIVSSRSAPAGVARGFLALKIILRAFQTGRCRAPADTLLRCARLYDKLMHLAPRGGQEAGKAFQAHLHGRNGPDPVQDAAIRLTYNVFFAEASAGSASPEESQINEVLHDISEELMSSKEVICA